MKNDFGEKLLLGSAPYANTIFSVSLMDSTDIRIFAHFDAPYGLKWGGMDSSKKGNLYVVSAASDRYFCLLIHTHRDTQQKAESEVRTEP